jgi:cell division protein ZapB
MLPLKEGVYMDKELFAILEERIDMLLESHAGLKLENARLSEENRRLLDEREALKGRLDAILRKLEVL